MSENFSIIPIRQLLAQILKSEAKGSIFGIYQSQFYKPNKKDVYRTSMFGQMLETPLGVAAGPHTQLAQNIISAWLCGARYIELKTIQTLDKIKVSKPCIDIQDEGYNCEWSQELKIEESFDEYLKAWIIIHILRHKFGWNKNIGTIFNMSVGYDMAGILKDNVQWFLAKMINCREEKDAFIDEIKELYPAVNDIEIPDCISNNVTLSTMHGCPSDEIEKIGQYLIEAKKLHTFIKLNPTLLGKEKIHKILTEILGFETIVPDTAFEHDIIYPTAVKLIQSLQQSAQKQGVFFGVKLTNTLEAINHKNIFSDESMYMSGKALHPISINVARKLKSDTEIRNLHVSFCGGVNVFNVTDVLTCGLYPVTVCSDLLKPGGYARLPQYLEEIEKTFTKYETTNLQDFILVRSKQTNLTAGALANLNEYADNVVNKPVYKSVYADIKTQRELTEFDCIAAPCVNTCPSNQNIPEYMYRTAKGDFSNAFDTIMLTNPFPSVTGMVCDHPCQSKCTRINYDNSLLIREVKHFIAENAVKMDSVVSEQKNGKKVTIIGAGPSGLSCAWFLVLAGFDVDVFETKEFPGGMLADAIPLFRLSEKTLSDDINRIRRLGVKIYTSTRIDVSAFNKIKDNSDFIYIAVGAQQSMKVSIEGDDVKQGLLDPLKYLSAVRKGESIELGKKVIVLGGGNTAIDAARTAKRFAGKNGSVTIVYRRTHREMPADQNEIRAALDEGIELIELAAPAKINSVNGSVRSLVCYRMKLQEIDEAGRPRPVKIDGSEFEIAADTIIPAFGQTTDIDFIDQELLEVADPETREIKLQNAFIGGDAYRGASTVIKAIADGRKTAETITKKAGIDLDKTALRSNNKELTRKQHHEKRARIVHGIKPEETPLAERDYFSLVDLTLTEEEAQQEASRCLFCNEVCDICVTVCPNRANYGYTVEPFEVKLQKAVNDNGKIKIVDDKIFKIEQPYQVLNIDEFCNECGNCTTFCPTSGAPHKDKPKVFLTEKSFRNAESGYYLKSGKLLYKTQNVIKSLELKEDQYLFESEVITATLNRGDFSIIDIKFKDALLKEASLANAVKMSVIFFALKDL
jgi:putative selenate reductase